MVFSMPTYFNPVGKERRRSVHQYSSGTLNLPKAVMIINSQMLWVLWNTLPILWGNNYFRINQSFLIQTLFIIFWSTPWNATLNTNFSLIGLMETISLFSKNLLSEWNLNILLFFCLVNHWFIFFSCWLHLEMSYTSQKHVIWKDAEQSFYFSNQSTSYQLIWQICHTNLSLEKMFPQLMDGTWVQVCLTKS